MALDLSLSILEENDNTGLQITDATGTTATGTATGWGVTAVEQNPPATVVVTDIVAGSDVTTASKWHLLLDVIVTTSDGTSTTYDQINLYDLDTTGPFADNTELVWVIDPSDLVSDSEAMGESTDELVDGIYYITYSLVDNAAHGTIEDAFSVTILVDGKVRVKVYDVIRQIQSIYNCTNEEQPIYNKEFRDVLVALLKYGIFRGLLANLSSGNTTEILNILDTLERLTTND